MNQLEENIVNSFRMAKTDIMKLQNDFIELNHAHQRVLEILNELNTREAQLYQRLKNMPKPDTKVVAQKKVYVASKSATKFHLSNCPFAQNIKPKSKQVFVSKVKALNQGYKPCNCVK
jgi:hypothetical protein